MCVCVNCLPYRSCFHWNDDLIVESGAVQLFESHLYIQLCLYKSLWLIGYQTENQSVASSEQLTGSGLLTCGRELCFCLHGSSFVHFVSGVRLWSTAEDSESAVAISWWRKATWGQTVREQPRPPGQKPAVTQAPLVMSDVFPSVPSRETSLSIFYCFRFISRAVLITDGSILPGNSDQQVRLTAILQSHTLCFWNLIFFGIVHNVCDLKVGLKFTLKPGKMLGNNSVKKTTYFPYFDLTLTHTYTVTPSCVIRCELNIELS